MTPRFLRAKLNRLLRGPRAVRTAPPGPHRERPTPIPPGALVVTGPERRTIPPTLLTALGFTGGPSPESSGLG